VLNGLQNLNVANNINAGTISASITTANQPNITNVGTLTNLNVSNNINTNNLTATGTVNTAVLSAALANITTISGVQNLNVAGNINAASLTISGLINTTDLTATGTVNAGTLSSALSEPYKYQWPAELKCCKQYQCRNDQCKYHNSEPAEHYQYRNAYEPERIKQYQYN
jgi:hypothetical protein